MLALLALLPALATGTSAAAILEKRFPLPTCTEGPASAPLSWNTLYSYPGIGVSNPVGVGSNAQWVADDSTTGTKTDWVVQIDDGYIRSVVSPRLCMSAGVGKCSFEPKNGDKITMTACPPGSPGGDAAQGSVWVYTEESRQFRLKDTNFCMDLPDGKSNVDGVQLQIWDCHAKGTPDYGHQAPSMFLTRLTHNKTDPFCYHFDV